MVCYLVMNIDGALLNTFSFLYLFLCFFRGRLFQMSGDLEDLEPALGGAGRERVVGSGSCSALVKLLQGNSDLYVAQDTWTGYETMLRVLKKYNLGYHLTPGGKRFSNAR